jgi:excisionase family DNA binding protein
VNENQRPTPLAMALELRGVSERQLAVELGVAPHRVRNWSSRGFVPGTEEIRQRVAERLGFTVEELFPVEDEEVEPLYSLEQVAEIIGVSRPQVYRLVEHHGLPTIRISDRVQRVRESDLETWLDGRSREKEGT